MLLIKLSLQKLKNINYLDCPLIFRSKLTVRQTVGKLIYLQIPLLLMMSKYTLISRFSRSTKNALPSGKHSCYSSFHFKADLVIAEPKFLIKLWPDTSIVHLFITI